MTFGGGGVRIEKGRYESEGQPAIIVVDDGVVEGSVGGATRGPWITWRLFFDKPDCETKTLWYKFEDLIREAGYELAN